MTQYYHIIVNRKYGKWEVKENFSDYADRISVPPFNGVYHLDNPVIMGSGDIVFSTGTAYFSINRFNLAGHSPLKVAQHTRLNGAVIPHGNGHDTRQYQPL